MSQRRIKRFPKKDQNTLLSHDHTVATDGKFSAHIWRMDGTGYSNLPLLVAVHRNKEGVLHSTPFVMVKSLTGDHSLMPFPNENGHRLTPVGDKMGRNQLHLSRGFLEPLLDPAIRKWERKYGPITFVKLPAEAAKPEIGKKLDRDDSLFEIYKHPFIVRVHIPDHVPMHLHVYYVDPESGQKVAQTRFKYVKLGDEFNLLHYPHLANGNGAYKPGKKPIPEDLMQDAHQAALECARVMYDKWNEMNSQFKDAYEERPEEERPRWEFLRAVQAYAREREAREREI